MSTLQRWNTFFFFNSISYQGRIQDFKLREGAHLKKLRRAEGGAYIFGVFSVKNHDFTPKKSYFFPNTEEGAKMFGGISCEKSRFYAKKSYFFPILGMARAGCPPPPPGFAPGYYIYIGDHSRFLAILLRPFGWVFFLTT